ncbi:MAG: MFS transporter [Kiritimatiellae bacterium]|nr:MFS transporter [Kiritimatiellia bacterium]
MSNTSPNSRRTAAFILVSWLRDGTNPATLLPEDASRAFVQDMVFTALKRLRALRFALSPFLKTWPRGWLEALLYIGAVQILYMDGVPDFAAVNETVDAARRCDRKSIARVVNAVLRNLLRSREDVLKSLANANVDVRESIPRELYRRWLERHGEEDAETLARTVNTPADTFIARPDGTFTPLAHGCKVQDVDGYAEGAFIVQDPATRHAVELLDPQPGETVLDACAAPGGKTIQMFWRGADVVACEVNPARRKRLAANLARVGAADIKIIQEMPPADWRFDKILVDAPCSNTGVLRRRPDARWNWSPERLASLVRIQASILDAAVLRLKPGGLLVYSTCSNEPEENMMQVEAFLKRHPDFSLVATREETPLDAGHDGAFAASFRKGSI